MKLFIEYMKSKLSVLFAFAVFTIIFIVSFIFYGIPLSAIFYPLFLCIISGVFFIFADFGKQRQKYNNLNRITKLCAEMIDKLPKSDSICENRYNEIIVSLKKEVLSSQKSAFEKYNDTIEYYTVWAHQIKTPIASMKLTLQSEDSAMARRLTSELVRIEQYVEMVLVFLRLDSDSTDYLFKEYSLDELLQDSIKTFTSDFINKKIKLIYENTNKLLITDKKWFEFIIEQILSNSLKYTNKGFVEIYTENENTLCIKDSGIGIEPYDLPRIFEKGYTGSIGRSNANSSGIGLYLCKRVCDNLGISITAESVLGEGTVIKLDLSQGNL